MLVFCELKSNNLFRFWVPCDCHWSESVRNSIVLLIFYKYKNCHKFRHYKITWADQLIIAKINWNQNIKIYKLMIVCFFHLNSCTHPSSWMTMINWISISIIYYYFKSRSLVIAIVFDITRLVAIIIIITIVNNRRLEAKKLRMRIKMCIVHCAYRMQQIFTILPVNTQLWDLIERKTF